MDAPQRTHRRSPRHLTVAHPATTPDVIDLFREHVAQSRPDLLKRTDLLIRALQDETSSRNQRRGARKKPLVVMKTEEIATMFAVLEQPQDRFHAGPHWDLSARRLRAAMSLMDRTGVRVSELLALVESDLNREDRTIVVRHGKGDKRRVVGMDAWGWRELDDWLIIRNELVRPGRILPVITGPTAGGEWSDSDLRRQLAGLARRAGLQHTAHPHSYRHGFSVRYWRATGDMLGLSAQLGHADLDVTSVYLGAIDSIERLQKIIDFPAPVIQIPHSSRR
jgi:site-specific recombinase XerD